MGLYPLRTNNLNIKVQHQKRLVGNNKYELYPNVE